MSSILQAELLEEIVALVIYEYESREILNMDLPDGFHSEFRIFHALNALDIVLSEDGCRATDRAEVESSVFVTSVCHLLASVALCKHDHASAMALEEVHV